MPIGVDADDVLAKGPSASDVDNVNAVLEAQGAVSGTLVSLLPHLDGDGDKDGDDAHPS